MDALTEEEAAIYDRQLRVWGVEAQQRLRNSRILILGCAGAAHEATKNLILAGIGTMILVDGDLVCDTCGSFLIPAGMAREGISVSQLCAEGLKEMNPLVTLEHVNSSPIEYLESGDLSGFDAVLAFDLPAFLISKADALCTKLNIPFASCNARGSSGWIFLNQQTHTYVVEESFENESGESVKNLQQRKSYGIRFSEAIEQFLSANPRRRSPLFDALKACISHEMTNQKLSRMDDYNILRDMLEGNDGPNSAKATALYSYLLEEHGLPAINAILGGILANDVIKIVSKKGDLSVDKIFMYSILDGGGWTGF